MAGMNWPTAQSSSSPIPTVSAGPGTSAAAAGGQDARTSTTSHFINAVVDDIAGHVTIDPKRRYATGISNGGMLAYALACNTGTFAAIGPDSATQLDKCAAPHPTSVMHIHGTADPRIRYDGDPGSGVATPDGGPSMPDLNAFWRNVDHCASPATTTDDQRVSITTIVRLSRNCNMGACQTRMSSPIRSRSWRTTTQRHHRY